MGVQDIDKLIETIDFMKEHGVIKNRIDKIVYFNNVHQGHAQNKISMP